jgi:putative sugar O-methyltransferase
LAKIYANELWRTINNQVVNGLTDNDLESFREPGNSFNSRVTTWGAYDNTYRYYKNILFNTAMEMPQEFFDLYKKIPNTRVGNPLCVTVSGLKINMEYLFSVQEIMFLGQEFLKREGGVNSCTEIGGGYGRLCHAVIELFPNISSYTMVDLAPMQKVSKMYLSKVLPSNQFKKVNFVEVNEVDKLDNFDLAININSFAEMRKEHVDEYLNIINNKANMFYSRNTIGKYTAESIGLLEYDEKQMKSALESGKCQNEIDIFDSDILISERRNYLKSYRPDNRWIVIKDEISYPYTYYHHVLYAKSS